jgi:hypothetical protein
MDWRGKIIRIKPDNSEKGYSIPAGNYWQKYFELGGAWVAGEDTSKILKEIYVVGSRSPWTLTSSTSIGAEIGAGASAGATAFGAGARSCRVPAVR